MKYLLLVLLFSLILFSTTLADDNISTTNLTTIELNNISKNTTNNTTINDTNIIINDTTYAVNLTAFNITSSNTNIICNITQCSSACIKCFDNVCHPVDFVCKEELTLIKITPNYTNLGETQINLLIKNTGNVIFYNLTAEVSGQGIKTIESLPLEKLSIGEKDYLFIKVNITSSGEIDLVLRINQNNILKQKIMGQISVLRESEVLPVNQNSGINSSSLDLVLTQLKEKFRDLEQEYQNKKMDDYPVDYIYDKLKDTHDTLTSAQSYYFEGEYKKSQNNLEIVKYDLNTIENQLKNAKKKETSLVDKIKQNIIYIGSIAAALISTITAYSLIRSHINKQKLVDLEQKIRFKKKEDPNTNSSSFSTVSVSSNSSNEPPKVV